MKLNIEVETGEKCGFNILDTTCGDLGYLPESSQEEIKDRFKYTETVALIRLTINKSNGSVSNKAVYYIHNIEPDYLFIPTTFDGWFTLEYIVIPTKTWFDNTQMKDQYYTIYYSDGVDIYKYFNGESTIVEELELFERNTEETTISKYTLDFMSICFLKRCFINICKLIFDLRGFNRCKSVGTSDELLIFNRDLLWMSINTISYLTEFGQLAEAERVLENMISCNSICPLEQINNSGCGC